MLDGSPFAIKQPSKAETHVLSHLMLDGQKAINLMAGLKPEHFSVPAYGTLYTAMRRLVEAGERVSPMTLSSVVDLSQEVEPGLMLKTVLQGVGGFSDSLKLTIAEVINASHARRLRETAEKLLNDLAAGKLAAEAGRDLETSVASIGTDYAGNGHVAGRHAGEIYGSVLAGIFERIEKGTDGRVPTGFKELDEMIGGLAPGRLYVIAARPSFGKSAFAGAIVSDVVFGGHAVGVWSMEMKGEEIISRMISKESGINAKWLDRGFLDEAEVRMVSAGKAAFDQSKFWIDDQAGLTMTEMSARIRARHRHSGIRLAVVDYLQLTKPSGVHKGNMPAEIKEMTVAFKALAKQLDIPIIILSQLNRGLHSRENKRPQLSDLKGSGGIEEDADCVMLLHRPDLVMRDLKPDDGDISRLVEWQNDMAKVKGKAEIVVAKSRQGECGIVEMRFEGNRMEFVEVGRPNE